MPSDTLLLFALTVFPLVCSPGPDILFVASQGLSGGRAAVRRATLGILAGYSVHALLAAFGIAALLSAWPPLLHAIRWTGLAYLLYLAWQMFRAASRPGSLQLDSRPVHGLLRKGLLTSLLNPKGLLIYLSILPNFIRPGASVATQALLLSGIFIASCAVVYSVIGYSVAGMAGKGHFSDRKRRLAEATAGGLLLLAAGKLAS